MYIYAHVPFGLGSGKVTRFSGFAIDCLSVGPLWAGPLWALMGRAPMGTLVNQRLGSMANPLILLRTLQWHKTIYLYIHIYRENCLYMYIDVYVFVLPPHARPSLKCWRELGPDWTMGQILQCLTMCFRLARACVSITFAGCNIRLLPCDRHGFLMFCDRLIQEAMHMVVYGFRDGCNVF